MLNLMFESVYIDSKKSVLSSKMNATCLTFVSVSCFSFPVTVVIGQNLLRSIALPTSECLYHLEGPGNAANTLQWENANSTISSKVLQVLSVLDS
jgi:hypothetical protein